MDTRPAGPRPGGRDSTGRPEAPLFRRQRGTGFLPAVWTLFRFLPVVSWSASASLIGVAAAVGAVGWKASLVPDALLILAGSALFQGLVAHGLNDLEDSRSGTDLASPGVLSGGSRVIIKGLLTRRQVLWVARAALAAGLASAALLYLRHGPIVIWVVLAGVWCAVSYTAPPLRLAYRPFVGELLAGWPAVAAIIAGGAAVMGGPAAVGASVWAAAAIQATLSVAWVMQHHLPDIGADLGASPPKITTPAFFACRMGLRAARLVPALYFFAAAAISAGAAVMVSPAFIVSTVPSGLGAAQALSTDVSSVSDVTARQLVMMGLTAANAVFFIMAFVLGWFGG